MLSILLSVFGILFTILFVIGTHEYAHFLVARLFKVKVLRFSIGFGKTLFSWRDKHNTEYVFALIPLGGYVKMLDEREGKVAAEALPYAFNRQSFYKKCLIVLAGPCMNILCALGLYWLIMVIGFTTIKPIIGSIAPHSIAAMSGLKPQQIITHVDGHPTLTWTSVLLRLIAHVGNHDHLQLQVISSEQQVSHHALDLSQWQLNALTPDPLGSLGIMPFMPTIPLTIGVVADASPASQAKLQVGDTILAINNQPLKSFGELTHYVNAHPLATIILSIKRNEKIIQVPVTLASKQSFFFKKTGYLGIAPELSSTQKWFHHIQYSPLAAIPKAYQALYDLIYFNVVVFGKLITGKLSLQSLGGPITIFEGASDAFHLGLLSFINFLAFLSVAVGVINLFPIPGLDGGHILIYCIEAIIRRPLPDHIILNIYRLGFLLILFIFIQAITNDLLRLFH